MIEWYIGTIAAHISRFCCGVQGIYLLTFEVLRNLSVLAYFLALKFLLYSEAGISYLQWRFNSPNLQNSLTPSHTHTLSVIIFVLCMNGLKSWKKEIYLKVGSQTYNQNNSYEVTINGYQARNINEMKNVIFDLQLLVNFLSVNLS